MDTPTRTWFDLRLVESLSICEWPNTRVLNIYITWCKRNSITQQISSIIINICSYIKSHFWNTPHALSSSYYSSSEGKTSKYKYRVQGSTANTTVMVVTEKYWLLYCDLQMNILYFCVLSIVSLLYQQKPRTSCNGCVLLIVIVTSTCFICIN